MNKRICFTAAILLLIFISSVGAQTCGKCCVSNGALNPTQYSANSHSPDFPAVGSFYRCIGNDACGLRIGELTNLVYATECEFGCNQATGECYPALCNGNFICESGETADNCPNDCGCMDHDGDNPATASYVNYQSPLGMQVVFIDECSIGGSELSERICRDNTQPETKLYSCSSLDPDFVCIYQQVVTSQGERSAGYCAKSTSTNPPVTPTHDIIEIIITAFKAVACVVYCLIIAIITGVAALALILAGVTYMTSEDPSDRSEARRRIAYVIIGVVIAVLACPIINILFAGTVIDIGGVGPCSCPCSTILTGGDIPPVVTSTCNTCSGGQACNSFVNLKNCECTGTFSSGNWATCTLTTYCNKCSDGTACSATNSAGKTCGCSGAGPQSGTYKTCSLSGGTETGCTKCTDTNGNSVTCDSMNSAGTHRCTCSGSGSSRKCELLIQSSTTCGFSETDCPSGQFCQFSPTTCVDKRGKDGACGVNEMKDPDSNQNRICKSNNCCATDKCSDPLNPSVCP